MFAAAPSDFGVLYLPLLSQAQMKAMHVYDRESDVARKYAVDLPLAGGGEHP